ncbi:hypothetical protein COO91_03339 [Nostoc flagelliforme CCNUN1]|uniref:Uncharacterized protein n=1 Tax=Nostoc flagelliforme CCNUN1 TaxID=2038116 RepID=A0A2K8SPK2_9NOSO|nr:hypothetical protein COO91_03339 [Nostoc flagelliforme CCNUN1]
MGKNPYYLDGRIIVKQALTVGSEQLNLFMVTEGSRSMGFKIFDF